MERDREPQACGQNKDGVIMARCPTCGHVLTCPRCTGKAGGEARKVKRGFADWPDAQAKAQATKRNKRLALMTAAERVRR